MSEIFYTLPQVEQLFGIKQATMRKRLNRHPELGIKGPDGWSVPASVLNLERVVKIDADPYQALHTEWIKEQENGLHTGKPLSPRTVGNNKEGMALYWRHLKKTPSLELISPDNLAKAISSIPVDYEKRDCHFASKESIYKAILSFAKIMIRRGLLSEHQMVAFKSKRPKRVFPARKTVLQEDAFQRFLECNQKLHGRTEFDVILGNILIGLMAYAGLRRDEVIHLGLANVDQQNGLIRIIHAKGNKPRLVGINEQLDKFITDWLKIRPSSISPRFLLKEDGEPITVDVVRNRIYRLAKRNGFDITPHGLRRTFATLNSNKGVPLDKLRLTLGHNNLETTQGYLMTDEMEAAAAIRGNYKKQSFEQARQNQKTLARQKLLDKSKSI